MVSEINAGLTFVFITVFARSDAVTQFDDDGLPVAQLLVERGADLAICVKLPGAYERPGEIVECTPLGYALLFGGESHRRTIALLREWGAVE